MAVLWSRWLILALSVCLTGRMVSGQSTPAFRKIQQKLQELETKLTQMSDFFNNSRVERDKQVKHECPSEFYEHEATHSCYRVVSKSKSWYEARVDCQNHGAHLVWFDSLVEYRHVVIKLLTDIAAEKDYNNAGYWSSANDITGGHMVWDDTDAVVPSFFGTTATRSTRYGYSSSSSSSSGTQKHCMFMKYERQQMQITRELSECDGGRLYICKCKTDTTAPRGCSAPKADFEPSDKDD